MLVAAGCGGDDDSSPTPASPTPDPTAPPGTSGPGVTETEIHLGMTSDVAGAGETPYAAVSLAVKAYFQNVNQEESGSMRSAICRVRRIHSRASSKRPAA